MLATMLLTLSLMAATPQSEPAAPVASEAPSEADPAPRTPAEISELERLAAEEVEALHKFFHDWFVGALPDTDEAYARFGDALAEEFTIISPSGAVAGRDELLARLRESHGSGKEQGVKIWINGFQVRQEFGDFVVVNYEEWQELGSRTTGRVSTAILTRDENAPGGVSWLHLHETWLPRPAIDAMLGRE